MFDCFGDGVGDMHGAAVFVSWYIGVCVQLDYHTCDCMYTPHTVDCMYTGACAWDRVVAVLLWSDWGREVGGGVAADYMHGLPCGCGECGMLAACAAMCDCGASKWSVRSCYVCCVLLHWCMCTAA
jgi:hypothetical protein